MIVFNFNGIGNETEINSPTHVSRPKISDVQCQKNEKRLEDWDKGGEEEKKREIKRLKI